MKINELSKAELESTFLQCCSSPVWAKRMMACMPISDQEALLVCADKSWLGLDESDYLKAFAGHPKIGKLESFRAQDAESQEHAAKEQTGMQLAKVETIETLASLNQAYEKKFGFIFIVCATGKSAEEMLTILQARLLNERQTELNNAIEQQRLIFHIRLTQLS